MKLLWMAALALCLTACGGGDDNNENNGSNNGGSNTTPAAECSTDDDCPAASDATFNDASKVSCIDSQVRGAYCSECVDDFQCGAGFACRDATYCEELPACNVGSDCADAGSEVHKACIARFCDFCVDDADCESDEVCYSRLCATRTTIDPTCLGEGADPPACRGTCDIQYDGSNVATGVTCVE